MSLQGVRGEERNRKNGCEFANVNEAVCLEQDREKERERE